jgi:hypothetical protein
MNDNLRQETLLDNKIRGGFIGDRCLEEAWEAVDAADQKDRVRACSETKEVAILNLRRTALWSSYSQD